MSNEIFENNFDIENDIFLYLNIEENESRIKTREYSRNPGFVSKVNNLVIKQIDPLINTLALVSVLNKIDPPTCSLADNTEHRQIFDNKSSSDILSVTHKALYNYTKKLEQQGKNIQSLKKFVYDITVSDKDFLSRLPQITITQRMKRMKYLKYEHDKLVVYFSPLLKKIFLED